MDPLSITASAIALWSLAQATLVSLNGLVRDYKAFSQELATLGAELQSLSLVIKSLEKYVEGRSTLRAPLDDSHLLSALNACRPTLKAIKSKCKEIRRSAAQGPIIKLTVGFFWSSTKAELQELRASLESNKTTLLLSLQLKSLELHLASAGQKGKEDQTDSLGNLGTTKDFGYPSEYQNQNQYEGWKDGEWKNEGSREDEKWKSGDVSNYGKRWKDDAWKDQELQATGRWEENQDFQKWEDDGKWNEEWKEGSTQPAASRKTWTEAVPQEKEENKYLEKADERQFIVADVTTDQITPWWKSAEKSSISPGGQPRAEPANKYSPLDDNSGGLARSGIEVKTHQSSGEWRSTFNS